MEDLLVLVPYVVSPDLRVVGLLLENGADPNERCGKVPIWKKFMDE